ncbi:MAG: hypothetical protein LBG59_03080 [Candidatus Peribacteria bacterium]|nr:hypothetical protein [Candidatus Peribacteria bacterium]
MGNCELLSSIFMPMTPLARTIIMIIFILLCLTIKVVKQYERKVLFTLGKYTSILKP